MELGDMAVSDAVGGNTMQVRLLLRVPIKECMRTKFKITLGEKQREVVQMIKSVASQKIILFDDTSKVMIDKTFVEIDMHLFNSMEMMGMFSNPRKIGPNTFTYKLNINTLQKVVNL